MKTVSYMGYMGSVEFSDGDGIFFGRVLGIRDIISYEGRNIAELEDDFRGQIDFYLDVCKEHDRPAQKPRSQQAKSADQEVFS